MTLSSIISTSLTGLFTSQEALRVTGANIANVNSPDYARQVVRTAPDIQSGRSVGVKISEIERVVNRFLESAVLNARAESGRYEVMGVLHDRLQAALGAPDSETSLSARMDRVFGALATLSLNPSDAVTRQHFLSVIQGYTEELSRIGTTLQSLRGDASLEIEARIDPVNEALAQVFSLNQRIAQQQAMGGESGGLENQRQSALSIVSENLDIRTIENSDGSIDVVTGTGTQLVTRSGYSKLSYTSPGGVGAETIFPTIGFQRFDPKTNEPSGPVLALEGHIKSGALRGLMDLRDNQLVDLSIALGELAARVTDEMNAVHNLSTAVPPPSSLKGKAVPLTGTDPHNFTGSVTFAVVDTNSRVVAKTSYDFDANPGASIDDAIAALNAGLGGSGTVSFINGVMSFDAANSAHGVVIAEDPANTSDRGGRSVSHFFGMNDLLTARSPGIYETGLKPTDAHGFGPGEQMEFSVTDGFGRERFRTTIDTTGTTSYADILSDLNNPAGLGAFFTFALDSLGAMTVTPKPGSGSSRLNVLSDTTNSSGTGIGMSAMFGLGDRYRAEAAIDFRLTEQVPQNAGLLATARFELGAAVGDVALAVGDQRGALELQRLQDRVISTANAGELAAQKRTLSGFNGAVLGNFAVMADRVSVADGNSRALMAEVDQRRQSVSGVNVDEELANLIIYQNSYNAAARILSSVQDLYDNLLNAV